MIYVNGIQIRNRNLIYFSLYPFRPGDLMAPGIRSLLISPLNQQKLKRYVCSIYRPSKKTGLQNSGFVQIEKKWETSKIHLFSFYYRQEKVNLYWLLSTTVCSFETDIFLYLIIGPNRNDSTLSWVKMMVTQNKKNEQIQLKICFNSMLSCFWSHF